MSILQTSSSIESIRMRRRLFLGVAATAVSASVGIAASSGSPASGQGQGANGQLGEIVPRALSIPSGFRACDFDPLADELWVATRTQDAKAIHVMCFNSQTFRKRVEVVLTKDVDTWSKGTLIVTRDRVVLGFGRTILFLSKVDGTVLQSSVAPIGDPQDGYNGRLAHLNVTADDSLIMAFVGDPVVRRMTMSGLSWGVVALPSTAVLTGGARLASWNERTMVSTGVPDDSSYVESDSVVMTGGARTLVSSPSAGQRRAAQLAADGFGIGAAAASRSLARRSMPLSMPGRAWVDPSAAIGDRLALFVPDQQGFALHLAGASASQDVSSRFPVKKVRGSELPSHGWASKPELEVAISPDVQAVTTDGMTRLWIVTSYGTSGAYAPVYEVSAQ